MGSTVRQVVVVGGGVSGTLVSAHLLAAGTRASVVLVDPRSEIGRGTAYSTLCDRHLLNVAAGRISALPDDPGHFIEWAVARGIGGVGPESYLPRRLYGDYIRDILRQALGAAPEPHLFREVRAEVRGITSTTDGLRVEMDDGQSCEAAFVVLALGNLPPAPFAVVDGTVRAHPGYFESAWDAGALEKDTEGGDVLLIGTGLTAVDAVIGLRDAGHSGVIHAVSRHGRLPRVHRPAATPPTAVLPTDPPTSLRQLYSVIRRHAATAAEEGGDWRAVIDGLRPHTNALWGRLPERDQRRFHRHVRSIWDIHRHRMAPSIGESIDALIADGALQVSAGRIQSISPHLSGLRVCIRERHGGERRTVSAVRVINCTGPTPRFHEVDSELVRSLWAQGLANPGPLEHGLAVDGDGALLRSDGTSDGRIFTIGPTQVGTLFETTAMPEIRVQAARLAGELTRRLSTVA